jgi:hypothetical protein
MVVVGGVFGNGPALLPRVILRKAFTRSYQCVIRNLEYSIPNRVKLTRDGRGTFGSFCEILALQHVGLPFTTSEAWERPRGGRPPSPALEGVNGPISTGELCKALKRFNNDIALGVDGITAETLKPAIYARNNPFGKSPLEMINKLWTTKCVPRQWCSSAVVSIQERGHCCNQYLLVIRQLM